MRGREGRKMVRFYVKITIIFQHGLTSLWSAPGWAWTTGRSRCFQLLLSRPECSLLVLIFLRRVEQSADNTGQSMLRVLLILVSILDMIGVPEIIVMCTRNCNTLINVPCNFFASGLFFYPVVRGWVIFRGYFPRLLTGRWQAGTGLLLERSQLVWKSPAAALKTIEAIILMMIMWV